MGYVVVQITLGTTDKLVEQILPDEGNCAGHADQHVQLVAGGRKTVDLDEVVAVDVGGGVSGNRCHNFQVLEGLNARGSYSRHKVTLTIRLILHLLGEKSTEQAIFNSFMLTHPNYAK